MAVTKLCVPVLSEWKEVVMGYTVNPKIKASCAYSMELRKLMVSYSVHMTMTSHRCQDVTVSVVYCV